MSKQQIKRLYETGVNRNRNGVQLSEMVRRTPATWKGRVPLTHRDGGRLGMDKYIFLLPHLKLQAVLTLLDSQMLFCIQIHTLCPDHSNIYECRKRKTTYNLKWRNGGGISFNSCASSYIRVMVPCTTAAIIVCIS